MSLLARHGLKVLAQRTRMSPDEIRAADRERHRKATTRRRGRPLKVRGVHVIHPRWPVPLRGSVAMSLVWGVRRVA